MSLGLRVINGGRTAVCSTSDFSPGALARFAAETVELANIAAPDECAGLPDPRPPRAGRLSRRTRSLRRGSRAHVHRGARPHRAAPAKAAAFATDSRISNSDGASFSSAQRRSRAGELGRVRRQLPATSVSLVVEAMADDTGGKKRPGYWFSAERTLARLQTPKRSAASPPGVRSTSSARGRYPPARAPVIFEPMMAAQLMGMLAGCASGTALYRGATFLAGRAGQQLGSSLVHIVDDPLLPGRFGTRPFDGEGVAARRNVLFDGGVFHGFLFDATPPARQATQPRGARNAGSIRSPRPALRTSYGSRAASPRARSSAGSREAFT